MKFVVDQDHLGTPAEEWSASRRCRATHRLVAPEAPRVVVVAPHPDDEVLGAGGLVRELHDRGIGVVIVAVTDGEASHAGSPESGPDIRSIRTEESALALRRLGIADASVERLGIPDGQVTPNTERLEAELVRILRPTDLCLSPWERDGHPDHDACGRAVLNVRSAVGNGVLQYLVWALHWADPEGDDLPWGECRRYQLSQRTSRQKLRATLAFRSQIRPAGAGREAPVLPLEVLRRHWLDRELFIDPETKRS